ncbi:hypothetical protein SBF1_9560002 [Candidatus Desulfosporosinus infrequens]|uniref:Uncharacterized protein n=1 Tax=Candidatus Desulfosporosinus infrequens TaxID=2043169 RepID=A0A2U3LYN9_9FIRM|nr:hypothetical protein SBF1_9560002 [Candidatus Desulfosporosinus infrequens]
MLSNQVHLIEEERVKNSLKLSAISDFETNIERPLLSGQIMSLNYFQLVEIVRKFGVRYI